MEELLKKISKSVISKSHITLTLLSHSTHYLGYTGCFQNVGLKVVDASQNNEKVMQCLTLYEDT